jgi:hypothetical protein
MAQEVREARRAENAYALVTAGVNANRQWEIRSPQVTSSQDGTGRLVVLARAGRSLPSGFSVPPLPLRRAAGRRLPQRCSAPTAPLSRGCQTARPPVGAVWARGAGFTAAPVPAARWEGGGPGFRRLGESNGISCAIGIAPEGAAAVGRLNQSIARTRSIARKGASPTGTTLSTVTPASR